MSNKNKYMVEDEDTLHVAYNCSHMMWYQLANFEAIFAFYNDIGEDIKHDELRREYFKRCAGIDEKNQHLLDTIKELSDWVEYMRSLMPTKDDKVDDSPKSNNMANVVQFRSKPKNDNS